MGIYPLVETSVSKNWRDDERLAGLGISLTAGIYLAVRVVSQPMPPALRWLVVLTMLAVGVGIWLRQSSGDSRALRLGWLFIVQSLLLLLAAPLPGEVISAFVVGMVLSIVALWVTPALGKPRFSEGAWSWPYLPAVLATLTLVGAPFSLGWVARTAAYESILNTGSLPFLLLVLPAEALAFSSLVPYWQRLVGGSEQNMRRSVIGIVVMVPFLTPGLSPFVLEAVTRTTLPVSAGGASGGVVAALAGVAALAFALGYFRPALLNRLPRLAQLSATQFTFGQGLDVLVAMFDAATKRLLRLQVIFEGRHYIGWAVFMALVGLIVILLS
ncbi:MAG: hypothetical protein D6768_20665 [Chloroflexi bacterium]|nr:MAG: hypothetical protein D6768_20665 [Chloroflexota bacterium]